MLIVIYIVIIIDVSMTLSPPATPPEDEEGLNRAAIALVAVLVVLVIIGVVIIITVTSVCVVKKNKERKSNRPLVVYESPQDNGYYNYSKFQSDLSRTVSFVYAYIHIFRKHLMYMYMYIHTVPTILYTIILILQYCTVYSTLQYNIMTEYIV